MKTTYFLACQECGDGRLRAAPTFTTEEERQAALDAHVEASGHTHFTMGWFADAGEIEGFGIVRDGEADDRHFTMTMESWPDDERMTE